MAVNPYFTQYHTQRFSFIGSPQQRDGTPNKDQRFINLYPELIKSPISDGKKYYLKKRPGLVEFQTVGSGQGQGVFFWNGTYFTATGGQVYAGSTSIIGLTTSTGRVGFCEYRDDTQGDSLIIVDGTKGWQYANGVATEITDANFPSPHVPDPIFLDGYIFLAAAATETIHNSNLQSPLTWPSDGFIDAEMYPDNIVKLTKAQNYLVAIGTASIEFFYDNANATGSPLQRNAPAVAQFGCPAPMSVNQTEQQVIMVGATGNGGRTIWTINGFQPTEIASEPVREALDAEGFAISNAYANTVQCAGHKWYILSLTSSQRTFVYDFDEQMWHEWTSGSVQTAWQYPWGADAGDGHPVFLSTTGGVAVSLDPDVYTDLGSPIYCTCITSKIDFDTIKRKRIYRLSLIGDSPNGDSDVPVTVTWSDDDYNTWANDVELQLNGTNPTITQLGYTRRRAFQFQFSQPYELRLEAFELDIIQEVRR